MRKIHDRIVLTLLLGVLFVSGSCSGEKGDASASGDKVRMILDLDTGIDDAMALAYALGSPEVELLGIAGCFGNVTQEQGIENTLALLKLLGRTDVPVFPGAVQALNAAGNYRPDELTEAFHGANGIGDVRLPAAERKAEKEDAADFMIRMADLHGKELTIVATGPLTDLATAMERDPDFDTKVGHIVIMGGAVTVPGNMNHYAEANIHHDPTAARKVLKSRASITMVGLDVTLRTLLTKEETGKWRALQTPAGKAYADIVDFYIEVSCRLEPGSGGCALHDPLAVAVAIDPSLVTTLPLNMEVGTSEEDYGRTIGDPARLLEKDPNVSVCIGVDHATFCRRFGDRLQHLFQK